MAEVTANEGPITDTIEKREQRELEAVFGVSFTPEALPANITPEVLSAARNAYVEPWFYPGLDLPPIIPQKDLYQDHNYLEGVMGEITARYPNWRRLPLYKPAFQDIHGIFMPQDTYWEHIRLQKTDQPSIVPKWLITETIYKPEKEQPYPSSPITDALDLETRYVSWKTIDSALKKPEIQKWSDRTFGIPLEWRLPTLLELNIIVNRILRYNPSTVYEWTSTRLIHPRITTREPIDNYYQAGGAHIDTEGDEFKYGWNSAMIDHDPPTYKPVFGGIGFRLVAELDKRQ